MIRCPILLAAVLVTGAALSPLRAQKAPPASTQRPQTQPATAPTAGGKVPPGQAAPQPAATQPPAVTPTPTVTQAPAASPPAAAPASAAPAAPVTPQAVRPSASAATGTYTAGLAMAPYSGATTEDALEYAARFGRMLDSTIVTLVGTFRMTSGQPMVGASSPATLSRREQDRWARCRDLYWDLTTYAAAVGSLKGSLGSDPALQHAASELDSAFSRSVASAECDNVASMIAGPERWTPWQGQYESAARHFYRDFYAQVRDVHEKDRALMSALNRSLPAARRAPPPPGLPTNPPFAGAAPN
jgi:hypothetical protein